MLLLNNINNEIYGGLEVKIENDRGRKKNSRVERNYFPGVGKAKFSLGRLK